MAGAVAAVVSVVWPVVTTVVAIVVSLVAVAAAIVVPIVATISTIAATITTVIGETVTVLRTALTTAVGPLLEALKAVIETIIGVIDAVTAPILEPILDALTLIHDSLATVDAWVTEQLAIVHEAVELVSAASTVKLLIGLLEGTVSLTEVIDKVAEGKGFETAQALAQMWRSTVALGVGMIDKIDIQWEMTRATFTDWDEQFKRELEVAIDEQKAELMAIVTPRLDTLGRNQQAVLSETARISRHLEDVPWFMWMLIRALRM